MLNSGLPSTSHQVYCGSFTVGTNAYVFHVIAGCSVLFPKVVGNSVLK